MELLFLGSLPFYVSSQSPSTNRYDTDISLNIEVLCTYCSQTPSTPSPSLESKNSFRLQSYVIVTIMNLNPLPWSFGASDVQYDPKLSNQYGMRPTHQGISGALNIQISGWYLLALGSWAMLYEPVHFAVCYYHDICHEQHTFPLTNFWSISLKFSSSSWKVFFPKRCSWSSASYSHCWYTSGGDYIIYASYIMIYIRCDYII